MNNAFTLVELQPKSYGGAVALNNVNLKLPAGKIIGLLGPNRSGKTTMIKIINGLLQPEYGQVLINGLTPHQKQKLSFPIFQIQPIWTNK